MNADRTADCIAYFLRKMNFVIEVTTDITGEHKEVSIAVDHPASTRCILIVVDEEMPKSIDILRIDRKWFRLELDIEDFYQKLYNNVMLEN